jgi:hypothetical protein
MMMGLISIPLAFAAITAAQDRLPFQDDLWREFDVYRGRLLELAKAIPENQYGFRPAKDVRSIEEVIVHVSMNNYLLLDMMGKEAPKDLYPDLPQKGMDRQRAMVKANQAYEKKITGKQNVVAAAERAFAAAAEPLRSTSAKGLNEPQCVSIARLQQADWSFGSSHTCTSIWGS